MCGSLIFWVTEGYSAKKTYTPYMGVRKHSSTIIGGVLAIIGWVIAPVIDAKFKGTPLSGISGILSFWEEALNRPLPAWVTLTAVIAVASVAGWMFLRWRRRSEDRTDLKILVLPTPEPRWSIGVMGNEAHIQAFFNAKLAHRSINPLEIVSAHLEGTKCVAPFFPITVEGPYDPPQTIHLGVRPLLASASREIKRRVILVDQFGNEYRTQRITFTPMKHPANRFGKARIRSCACCAMRSWLQNKYLR